MSQIQVKKDNTLEQSEIIINLRNSSEEEMGDSYEGNRREIQQTSVYGIMAPLIAVNNIVIDYNDVLRFRLYMNNKVPAVSISVRDRHRLITTFDTPGTDNELRVQILPQYEDKYKKINLTFYIQNIKIKGDIINITGIYKSPKLIADQIKSFGEMNTYQLFETIANETGLGFATNIEMNESDKRYIYCNNISYLDLMEREIINGCIEGRVLDFWVDFWNNLVLCDIKDRYINKDKKEELKLWVADLAGEVAEGNETIPQEFPAILTNHLSFRGSEIYTPKYEIKKNQSEIIDSGSDAVYSIYNMQQKEYLDHLIQDGDVKNDVFQKLYYAGEAYGPYNYIVSQIEYNEFQKKISTNENIVVHLQYPLLGIMMGNQINFAWYIVDSDFEIYQENLENSGVIKPRPEPVLFPIPDEINIDGNFIEDYTVSGQYLITNCELKFSDGMWDYKISLSRPSSERPILLNE